MIFFRHNKVGCDVLRLILKNFTPVIKTNVLSGSAGMGVDISREERYIIYLKIWEHLFIFRTSSLE